MKLILENKETNQVRKINDGFNLNIIWSLFSILGMAVLIFKKEFKVVGLNIFLVQIFLILLVGVVPMLGFIAMLIILIYIILIGINSNRVLIKGYLAYGYEISNDVDNKKELTDKYMNYEIPKYFIYKV